MRIKPKRLQKVKTGASRRKMRRDRNNGKLSDVKFGINFQ